MRNRVRRPPPPAASRWKKGQSGNPKGRPKGSGLTDSLKRLIRGQHNGKPISDLLAESMLKHALSGKYQHAKEIWDRLEGRPAEHVKADLGVSHKHFAVPPPRVFNESEDEYKARVDLENAARDHQRMLSGRGDEGAGCPVYSLFCRLWLISENGCSQKTHMTLRSDVR